MLQKQPWVFEEFKQQIIWLSTIQYAEKIINYGSDYINDGLLSEDNETELEKMTGLVRNLLEDKDIKLDKLLGIEVDREIIQGSVEKNYIRKKEKDDSDS